MCRSRPLYAFSFRSCFKETYGDSHGQEKLYQVGVSFSFCAGVNVFPLYLTFEMALLGTVCLLLVIFYVLYGQ